MTDIFISYNHKDEAWKDELQAHLEVLQYHGEFSTWEDRQIKAGDNWLPEIEKAIQSAKIAILLVSRDFLTSDFVTTKEIPDLLKRREEGGLRVIPLVIKHCAWETVSWLQALQGGTKDNLPLVELGTLGSSEVDKALADFTREVHRQLMEINDQEKAEAVGEAEYQRQMKEEYASHEEVAVSPSQGIDDFSQTERKSVFWAWILGVSVLGFGTFFGVQVLMNKKSIPHVVAAPEPTLDEKIKQTRDWLESEDKAKERLAVEQLKQLQGQDVSAKFMLGAAYFYGLGVDEDKARGCELYADAAKAGNAKAQEVLDARLCQ